MSTDLPASFDFDVALSFAGEDRAYVHQIANLLRERGLRVFFDEFLAAELWGADLYAFFDDVFRKRARFAILFVSHSYVTKPWPKHESQSAQARALVETNPYILPVKLDDAELPGLQQPTVGYVDARKISQDDLVQLVLSKLGQTAGSAIAVAPIRVPRTTAQAGELLARRPPAWEYLLFAGVLLQGKTALETRWLDYHLGYVQPRGPYQSDSEVMLSLQSAMSDAQRYAANALKMLTPEAQTSAFGPPGTPGDAGRIEHLATRLVSVYESLIDWVDQIRGTRTSDKFAQACQLSGDLMSDSIAEFRRFIDDTVAQFDGIPEQLAKSPRTPIRLTLQLHLTVDPKAAEAIKSELERLKRSL